MNHRGIALAPKYRNSDNDLVVSNFDDEIVGFFHISTLARYVCVLKYQKTTFLLTRSQRILSTWGGVVFCQDDMVGRPLPALLLGLAPEDLFRLRNFSPNPQHTSDNDDCRADTYGHCSIDRMSQRRFRSLDHRSTVRLSIFSVKQKTSDLLCDVNGFTAQGSVGRFLNPPTLPLGDCAGALGGMANTMCLPPAWAKHLNGYSVSSRVMAEDRWGVSPVTKAA